MKLVLLLQLVACLWPNPANLLLQSEIVNLNLCAFNLIAPKDLSDKQSVLIRGAFARGLDFLAKRVSCPDSPTPTQILISIKDKSKDEVDASTDTAITESYTLTVRADSVAISAQTVIGVLRAVVTLFQLPEAGFHTLRSSLVIDDVPALKFRAVKVDTTRTNRVPISKLYQTIDKMELVKLNVLYWHITDTDGMSFALDGWKVSDPYSLKDINNIIQYGVERGISVIPEVDIAAKSGKAWAEQLGSADFANPACPEQLNLDSDTAISAALGVAAYISTSLFANSKFLGIGTDNIKFCGTKFNQNFKRYISSITQQTVGANRKLIASATSVLDGLLTNADPAWTILLSTTEKRGNFTNSPSQINYLNGKGFNVVRGSDVWNILPSSDPKSLYGFNPSRGLGNFALFGGIASISAANGDISKCWPNLGIVGEQMWRPNDGPFDGNRFAAISKIIALVPEISEEERSFPLALVLTISTILSMCIILIIVFKDRIRYAFMRFQNNYESTRSQRKSKKWFKVRKKSSRQSSSEYDFSLDIGLKYDSKDLSSHDFLQGEHFQSSIPHSIKGTKKGILRKSSSLPRLKSQIAARSCSLPRPKSAQAMQKSSDNLALSKVSIPQNSQDMNSDFGETIVPIAIGERKASLSLPKVKFVDAMPPPPKSFFERLFGGTPQSPDPSTSIDLPGSITGVNSRQSDTLETQLPIWSHSRTASTKLPSLEKFQIE